VQYSIVRNRAAPSDFYFQLGALKYGYYYWSHLNLDLSTSYRKCIFLLVARIQQKKK